jgi:hypothetical protein
MHHRILAHAFIFTRDAHFRREDCGVARHKPATDVAICVWVWNARGVQV